MRNLIPLFLTFFVTENLLSAPQSSVTLGTGGAGVASVEAGASSFTNPATLVHLRGRHFYSTFQKDLWALSIMENARDTVIPGAISYAKDDDVETFGLTFSQFVVRNISLGGTLNFWQAPVEEGETQKSSAFNAVAGVAWTPMKNLGFAAAFENIVSAADKFEKAGLMKPVSRIGMNYLYEQWFRARLDFVTADNNDFQKMTPQMGFESYMGKWSVIRVGWNRPVGLKESWTAGLGVDLPRFKIDYAAQWNVEGTKDSRHSVDLAVPF